MSANSIVTGQLHDFLQKMEDEIEKRLAKQLQQELTERTWKAAGAFALGNLALLGSIALFCWTTAVQTARSNSKAAIEDANKEYEENLKDLGEQAKTSMLAASENHKHQLAQLKKDFHSQLSPAMITEESMKLAREFGSISQQNELLLDRTKKSAESTRAAVELIESRVAMALEGSRRTSKFAGEAEENVRISHERADRASQETEETVAELTELAAETRSLLDQLKTSDKHVLRALTTFASLVDDKSGKINLANVSTQLETITTRLSKLEDKKTDGRFKVLETQVDKLALKDKTLWEEILEVESYAAASFIEVEKRLVSTEKTLAKFDSLMEFNDAEKSVAIAGHVVVRGSIRVGDSTLIDPKQITIADGEGKLTLTGQQMELKNGPAEVRIANFAESGSIRLKASDGYASLYSKNNNIFIRADQGQTIKMVR